MKIFIKTTINAPIIEVWKAWVTPEDIMQWNYATENWICPNAEIELKIGKHFSYRMQEKEGSMGFDFKGQFTVIQINRRIEYVLEDGRKVNTTFVESAHGIDVEQSFDAEDKHSGEQQRLGWLAILHNFKQYVENNRH